MQVACPQGMQHRCQTAKLGSPFSPLPVGVGDEGGGAAACSFSSRRTARATLRVPPLHAQAQHCRREVGAYACLERLEFSTT